MNRALDVETCCEEINVKSFVLQFCQEEVREIERTRLDLTNFIDLSDEKGLYDVDVLTLGKVQEVDRSMPGGCGFLGFARRRPDPPRPMGECSPAQTCHHLSLPKPMHKLLNLVKINLCQEAHLRRDWCSIATNFLQLQSSYIPGLNKSSLLIALVNDLYHFCRQVVGLDG